ncbi:hypothetical protein NLJ89_g3737 [Agrocybe chaxingu]|uniref:CENP-V/GFA domain-containing protein n=1 Tax=Agrocybe chaxingu TaxID=84603 RepID=A0A9W8MV79_9AGAR|nr:hypothetical protein NLJ89_g3737 [Agrocybe chaxingu]
MHNIVDPGLFLPPHSPSSHQMAPNAKKSFTGPHLPACPSPLCRDVGRRHPMPNPSTPRAFAPPTPSHLSKIHNPSDEKWWLAPRHSAGPKTKYLAGHCMCTFCRLTSGFEVQSWAFVPLVNVLVPVPGENGQEVWVPLCLEDEHRPKALKQYISSPGRYREFCGTCGATAFWWQLAAPDLLEVSVGLFDERIDGARAEDWLEWCTDRVSYEDKALSPEVAKALSEGLKESAKKVGS